MKVEKVIFRLREVTLPGRERVHRPWTNAGYHACALKAATICCESDDLDMMAHWLVSISGPGNNQVTDLKQIEFIDITSQGLISNQFLPVSPGRPAVTVLIGHETHADLFAIEFFQNFIINAASEVVAVPTLPFAASGPFKLPDGKEIYSTMTENFYHEGAMRYANGLVEWSETSPGTHSLLLIDIPGDNNSIDATRNSLYDLDAHPDLAASFIMSPPQQPTVTVLFCHKTQAGFLWIEYFENIILDQALRSPLRSSRAW